MLPVVVITELEGKRHHPELGYFARVGAADARRAAGQHGRLDEPVPVGDDGGTLRVELNHTDADSLPVGLPARRQRHPDPRGGAQPRQRGPRGHAGLQGPAAADQGLGRRPRRRGVPRRAGPRVRLRLDRHGRARRQRPPTSTSCTTTGASTSTTARDLPCHTGLVLLSERGSALGRVQRRQAGPPGARRPRGVRHPRPLAPSSGSRSTCCSTPRSASSRSAAGPAPASPRWRCAPVSRRCWSAASTRRSSCSGRCSRSAARSSATCPAASRRRCRPGARRSSTPSARSPSPTWSTRSSTAGCSRCCR